MANCPLSAKPRGPGSIAEQLVDHHIDVILGGGRGRFEQTVENGPYAGQTLVASAQDQGYRYVTTSPAWPASRPTPRTACSACSTRAT